MQVGRRGAWDLFLAARGTNRFLIGGGPDFIQIHLGPSFCFPPPPPLPPTQVSPARHSFHMPSSSSWFPHRYSRRSQRRKEGRKGGEGGRGRKKNLGRRGRGKLLFRPPAVSQVVAGVVCSGLEGGGIRGHWRGSRFDEGFKKRLMFDNAAIEKCSEIGTELRQ